MADNKTRRIIMTLVREMRDAETWADMEDIADAIFQVRLRSDSLAKEASLSQQCQSKSTGNSYYKDRETAIVGGTKAVE